MKVGSIDADGRAVINECDSCGGSHEVILKALKTNKFRSTGDTHWFECPQHAQGDPVMLKVIQLEE